MPRDNNEIMIHPTLRKIAELLHFIGLQTFIIDARGIMIHGVELGRETRGWDIVVDKLFTPQLRDEITKVLKNAGFNIQWRKWGFSVKNDIHIDINYAPLTLDEESISRSIEVEHGIFLFSLEDIIVLKLMSSERKDIDDLKKILRQAWYKLDKEYLYRRAKQAGLEKVLEKLVRRLNLQ